MVINIKRILHIQIFGLTCGSYKVISTENITTFEQSLKIFLKFGVPLYSMKLGLQQVFILEYSMATKSFSLDFF